MASKAISIEELNQCLKLWHNIVLGHLTYLALRACASLFIICYTCYSL